MFLFCRINIKHYICIVKQIIKVMTTATHNELLTIAKLAADYITKLNGEDDTFEVETENFTACIRYEAEYDIVRGGDSYCGIWEMVPELVSECTTVESLMTEDGEDREAAKCLEQMLN